MFEVKLSEHDGIPVLIGLDHGVEERDQLRQALLEIYVAVALETPFNDFDTH